MEYKDGIGFRLIEKESLQNFSSFKGGKKSEKSDFKNKGKCKS